MEKSCILTGELMDIYQALLQILNENTSSKNYGLCTDTLSSIGSLQKMYTDNVNEICNKLQQLKNLCVTVTSLTYWNCKLNLTRS